MDVRHASILTPAPPAQKPYAERVEYIHLNPVRRRLVRRPEEWKGSSYHEYAGIGTWEQEKRCGLTIESGATTGRLEDEDLKSRSPWKTGLRYLLAWQTV